MDVGVWVRGSLDRGAGPALSLQVALTLPVALARFLSDLVSVHVLMTHRGQRGVIRGTRGKGHGPLIAVSGTLEVEGVSPGRWVDPAGRVELTGHVHLVRGVIAVGAGRSSPFEQVHRVHLGWRSRVMGEVSRIFVSHVGSSPWRPSI